jgi:3-oxoacyl-[acyl-carrier-protein] synthase III
MQAKSVQGAADDILRAHMYINGLSEYLPERVVDNQFFSERTGRDPSWFETRTGMRQRRRAGPGENANTMAIEAVARLQSALPAGLGPVDLILGGSYTPWDTIATIAHVVQRQFALENARALYISSACSSFLNALELTAAYFESGRSKNALVIMSEHNSLYSKDDDPQSGHLWGDGASAMLISKDRTPGSFMKILDVTTSSLAHLGSGPEGVYLCIKNEGLVVPKGRDVFQHACRSMEEDSRAMLKKHGLTLADIRLFVAHQANKRIVDHVAQTLGLESDRVANTVETLGNTGCASVPISLLHYRHTLKSGDYVLLVAFGGGYSSGAALARVE